MLAKRFGQLQAVAGEVVSRAVDALLKNAAGIKALKRSWRGA